MRLTRFHASGDKTLRPSRTGAEAEAVIAFPRAKTVANLFQNTCPQLLLPTFVVRERGQLILYLCEFDCVVDVVGAISVNLNPDCKQKRHISQSRIGDWIS